MPQITHFPQPVTNNVISEDDFIAALEGKDFKQTDYCYKINGRDLLRSPLGKKLSWIVDVRTSVEEIEEEYEGLDEHEYEEVAKFDYETYLVFINAHIDAASISMYDDFGAHCIFYQCILPSLLIEECSAFDLFFIGTHIGPITINRGSCWGIYLEENSVCDGVSYTNGKGSGIHVTNKSLCGSIQIHEKSNCDEIRIEDNSQCAGIHLKDRGENEHIGIYDNSECGQIAIDDNCTFGLITIQGKSECRDIYISKTCKASQITVFRESKIGSIYIADKCRVNNISVSNSQCGDISLSNNSYNANIDIDEKSRFSKITISGRSLSDSISIDRETTGDQITIGYDSNCGLLEISHSRVNEVFLYYNTSSLHLYNAQVPLMRLSNCFLHELLWQAGTRGEIYIVGGTINYLNLYQTAILKDAVLSLINVQLYIVRLQEILVQGQLVLRNLRPATKPFEWQPVILKQLLKMKAANDTGSLPLSVLEAGLQQLTDLEQNYRQNIEKLHSSFKNDELPLFRVVDSSLSKTEITGSDLEAFHFEYRDSKLLETFFSGTKLPKDKIKIYNKDITMALPSLAYHEQKVSIYNQLKRIYDNQGDIVEATWYHAKAMDNQERLLKEKYKQDEAQWFGEQWFDLMTFRLNKVSNNHGESWRNALRFICIITLVMYSLYYVSLHYTEPFSFKATDRFVKHYFIFLDPTHKFDFHVKDAQLWWLPVFIDFIGRILLAYGIFQFISAFRRHGRK